VGGGRIIRDVGFGIIGLVLIIVGVVARVFIEDAHSANSLMWALFGSGIAIIWLSFLRSYRLKHK